MLHVLDEERDRPVLAPVQLGGRLSDLASAIGHLDADVADPAVKLLRGVLGQDVAGGRHPEDVILVVEAELLPGQDAGAPEICAHATDGRGRRSLTASAEIQVRREQPLFGLLHRPVVGKWSSRGRPEDAEARHVER